MSGNLSPKAQAQINELGLLSDKVGRAYSLVEQYAATKVNPDQALMPLTRIFTQLKMHFMGAGLDAMSQLAGSMQLAAKRSLPQHARVRILREGVGSMKFQLELAQRAIVSEEQAAARRQAGEQATKSDASGGA